MLRARLHWSAVVAVVSMLAVLSGGPAPLAAGPSAAKDARRIYDEATAAFGLGRYAEAAERYEQAFAIRPDPALLYNAAQAYRLGGNKARALELYRNYVRLYPDGTNAADARTHTEALKKAVEEEQKAAAANPPRAPVAPLPPATARSATAPPATAPPSAGPAVSAPMPSPVETTPPPPAAPPPAAESKAPMVIRPASQADEQPLTKQSWFWVAAGAGAVLIGAMLILAVTGGGETYPDPSYGTARGN